MFIQDTLRVLRSISATYPRATFLLLFTGAIITPLLVLAVSGGHLMKTSGQHGLAWLILGILLLLPVGIGGGLWIFRRNSYIGRGLSISRKSR